MRLALALAIAWFASWLCGRLAIAQAGRLRYLDHPGERKLQSRPVPLLGGLAIYGGLLLGLLALWWGGPLASVFAGALGPTLSILLRWLLGGAALCLVGMIDDRRGLSPLPRLVVQIAAVLLFAPELSAWLAPSWLGFLVGGIWVLGLVNSLNFLDNMDAIAGSSSLLSALMMGLLFLLGAEGQIAAAAFVFAAAVAGFLWWNRPPARLYMGDAGSTLLGYSLGLFTLLSVQRGGLSPWLAPLFVAVPLYDTGTVFWIRWREGRPIWVGDLRHATHRLLARTGRIGSSVAVLNAWTLAAAALALLWRRFDRLAYLPLLAALVLALLVFAWERRGEA